MPSLRPHRLTVLVALASAGVVAATAFALRDRIAEEWYLWRLESADPQVRAEAAEALVDRKCLRAAPRLVRRIEQLPGEEAGWDNGPLSSDSVHTARYSLETHGPGGSILLWFVTPLVHALYRLGPEVQDHLPDAPSNPRVAETFWWVRQAWAAKEALLRKSSAHDARQP